MQQSEEGGRRGIMVVVDLTKAAKENKAAIEAIEKKSGVKVSDCYQCGKCSAGCPVAFGMDLQPREVLRHLQLGRLDEVLHSSSVWLCASCSTCVTRCPQKVDLPTLMETIRQEAKSKGIITEKELNKFHDLFLGNVRRYGKSHEMFLAAFYNLTTGHLFQDVLTAPHLYLNRKIRIRPHTVKNKEAVRKIMQKCLSGGDK